MRGNLSVDEIEYIQDLKFALSTNTISLDEIVTINDQLMTVKKAISLYETGDLTSRIFNARQNKEK